METARRKPTSYPAPLGASSQQLEGFWVSHMIPSGFALFIALRAGVWGFRTCWRWRIPGLGLGFRVGDLGLGFRVGCRVS